MKARENARIISDMVNNMSFSPEELCKELTKDHRTLQQNFTRLCLEWIKTCASDEYRYDERNKASHVKCKDIVDTMSKDTAWDYLPFI